MNFIKKNLNVPLFLGLFWAAKSKIIARELKIDRLFLSVLRKLSLTYSESTFYTLDLHVPRWTQTYDPKLMSSKPTRT